MYDLAKKMKAIFTQQVTLSSSLLESVQSGKLSQFQATPEGMHWLGRATLSYWLKRWDSLYHLIVENVASDPAGNTGKKIADEWTGLIEDQLSLGNRAFMTGIILWQDIARQENELKSLKTPPSPQDMVKLCHIKLLFNPEAVSWISRALEVHTK